MTMLFTKFCCIGNENFAKIKIPELAFEMQQKNCRKINEQ
jgi:hypothetical protein